MLFTKEGEFYYKVQQGDTLWNIAVKLFRDGEGVCWEALYSENKNNLISGRSELICPNEVIRIPEDYVFLVKKYCRYTVL